MLDKSKLTGADISIDFCGCHLQSPYILSSGPLCYGAEGMIKGHEAGAGAVVTKTIRLGAAINPVHHMGTVNQDSLINCEKWADSDRLNWYENEIPKTVAAGAVVIGSVGHTLKEAQAIVKDVERAGAHMIELVSYTEDTLLPMLDYTKEHVDIPVICKLSGNWPDTVATARRCGFGWMTGAAMRPIAMRYKYQIAKETPQLMNLYASGGVMKADDAIEYMMAGAMGVGVCTAGILKGVEYVEKMCYDLSKRLAELGYSSIQEVNRAAHPNFPSEEHISGLKFHFTPFKEDGTTKKCVSCKKCETVCCYDARKLTFPEMTVDMDKCRCCGLCLDVCPTGALTAELAPQTEKDLELAQKSKDFYELVK